MAAGMETSATVRHDPLPMKHPFDEAITLTAAGEGGWLGHTHQAYWNRVGPFGGITAAVMLQSLLQDGRRLGEPLSLTVNYPAAVAQGPFTIRTTLVRSGRSTQHWSAVLVQDEAVMISVIAVFAVRRPVWGHAEARMPDVPAPQAVPPVNPRAGAEWPRRYDMRTIRGQLGQDNPDSLTQWWINDNPPRALDYPALAAICDAFFPRMYLHRATFVPTATVSLNIYFHTNAAALQEQGEAPVLGCAQGQVFDDGFADQVGQIWSSRGQLLATTHQIMWYRE